MKYLSFIFFLFTISCGTSNAYYLKNSEKFLGNNGNLLLYESNWKTKDTILIYSFNSEMLHYKEQEGDYVEQEKIYFNIYSIENPPPNIFHDSIILPINYNIDLINKAYPPSRNRIYISAHQG